MKFASQLFVSLGLLASASFAQTASCQSVTPSAYITNSTINFINGNTSSVVYTLSDALVGGTPRGTFTVNFSANGVTPPASSTPPADMLKLSNMLDAAMAGGMRVKAINFSTSNVWTTVTGPGASCGALTGTQTVAINAYTSSNSWGNISFIN